MSKEEDQKFFARHKAVIKWFKIQGLKLSALLFAAGLPVIGLIPAYFIWLEACKLQGPNLGKKPGRARMGTHDDLKKWMARR